MLGLPNHEGEEWNDAFGVVAGYFLQGIRGMAADGRLGWTERVYELGQETGVIENNGGHLIGQTIRSKVPDGKKFSETGHEWLSS